MPKHLLPVPHHKQRERAACLAACAAMVLNYLGLSVAYERLLKLLRVKPYGTSGRNLLHLGELGLQVTYSQASWEQLTQHIRNGRPCIALVRTSELPHWSFATDHAVVVVGFDDETVYVNDPYFDEFPQRVPIGDFMLAWLEFDYRYAVISR